MSKPLRIVIIGQNGQVSQALQKTLAGLGELIVLGRDKLDLSDQMADFDQIQDLKPDLIINAAAYTAVDQAETDQKTALAVNAIAAGMLADQAKELGIPLIHYSTDYVFDGSKAMPWTEQDKPAPLGVYGASKWAGEQAIEYVGGQYLILRTSWVYSNTGRNFLLTMQRLLQERDSLNVVADQVGAPTWAGTIAQSTRQLIEYWRDGKPGAWGTYHLTASGETSWFGFTQAIAEQLSVQGKKCATLEAIPSSAYPTPAARPLNSRLDCSLLQREWGVKQPDWHSALLECLAEQG
ncbi:dTDP-4-dehydrorhamnose reductase [Pseudomonas quasicaspiana]|uniref:dTDP-4-dehydrorhamnose reductase n=1 Tax=Pseudomonas quasicaspiana TaxID=2829821 RepID=UPI000F053FFC|nr:dTDP-4-dehydrorhamnose reductase [Pseudomonas quasicaspiana]MCD5977737.1 dTDP-4-dehydrorhamnose reductase [Pseudomonas quasicaspiana]